MGKSYGSIWYYVEPWGSFHKEQAVANAVGISPGFLLKQVDGKRTCSAVWWCGDMRCWFLIQHALKLDAVHGPPWAALFWPRLATGESGDLFNIVKLLSSFTVPWCHVASLFQDWSIRTMANHAGQGANHCFVWLTALNGPDNTFAPSRFDKVICKASAILGCVSSQRVGSWDTSWSSSPQKRHEMTVWTLETGLTVD